MLRLRFKVGLIMYISFDCRRPRSPSWSSWITTRRLFLYLDCVSTQGLLLCPHTKAKLCDFYLCTIYCHVIYAQWPDRASDTLLRYLRPYLSLGIRLSLPISWRLDPSGPSRSSVTHSHWGSHTTPSRLSQATSVVDVTRRVDTLHGLRG